ncbi:PRD domain-containing protein [Breznakiella homolactica]|uniref:PRD domain-containing protein n=1 Tax=Breznakiella homolactica TaxID=2798577 RepID=A0A7T7XR32_9SPIR|nr:PRD domain-containing protein [Breznakiella homolactica]QQO10913.1 PRD domain-containing protein [Breznakiella homolactica]
MGLEDRLKILLSGNLISDDVYHSMQKVINRLSDKWGIALNEKNGSRIVTHVAMALMRISRNEEISPPEHDLLDEFRDCEGFHKAVDMADDLTVFVPMELPRSERDYLIMHLCLILEDL